MVPGIAWGGGVGEGDDTRQMADRAYLPGAAAADLLCSQQNPYKIPDTSKTGCKLRWFQTDRKKVSGQTI